MFANSDKLLNFALIKVFFKLLIKCLDTIKLHVIFEKLLSCAHYLRVENFRYNKIQNV